MITPDVPVTARLATDHHSRVVKHQTRREYKQPPEEIHRMLPHKQFTALLLMLTSFLMVPCAGCSDSFQEEDATQGALDEVEQSYPDPEQIMCEVTSAKRRADSGWTVQVSVLPVQAEGYIRPNVHEVDMTPDRAVVDHLKNGQKLTIED